MVRGPFTTAEPTGRRPAPGGAGRPVGPAGWGGARVPVDLPGAAAAVARDDDRRRARAGAGGLRADRLPGRGGALRRRGAGLRRPGPGRRLPAARRLPDPADRADPGRGGGALPRRAARPGRRHGAGRRGGVRRAEGARRAATEPARRPGADRPAVPPGRAGLVPRGRPTPLADRAGPGGVAGPGGRAAVPARRPGGDPPGRAVRAGAQERRLVSRGPGRRRRCGPTGWTGSRDVVADPATFDRDDGFDLGGYWREQAEAFLRDMLRRTDHRPGQPRRSAPAPLPRRHPLRVRARRWPPPASPTGRAGW